MPMKDCTPLNSRGQSMTEVAFLLPVLLLLILGAVDVAQVLSAQQHLEQAAYVAALRLRSTPSLGTDSTRLRTFIQTESGLAPVTAGASYNVGGDGADQVVVTATYGYPLVLPGLGKLLTGTSGSGTWKISVSRASVATTDPPAVTAIAGSVQVVPPSGNTVPSSPTPQLTCTLYQNGTPVPTPTPAPLLPCTWTHPNAVGTTYTYTATVMQVNGITSPPSTPVTGP
jgi:Flp pilus assembly protein TadG